MSWVGWLSHWQFDPSVWIGCALALAAYRWFPGAHLNRRALLWATGVLIVFIALESALDIVGDQYLFSVHMVQHLVLAMVAPPLMILGLPPATVDALLQSRLGHAVRVVVNPLFAGSAYFLVLVLWHWPAFFDYALSNPPAHIAQHLSFVAVGMLFWWAVILHRPGEAWSLGPIGEVAYLTFGALPAVVVGLTLALLPRPVYTFYLTRSPQLGFSALADQRFGGLIMFIFDNLLMVAVAGYYLWRMFPADGADEARIRADS